MMHIARPINVNVCLFPATPPIMIIDWHNLGQMTIDTLTDDALLYVFDFYVA